MRRFAVFKKFFIRASRMHDIGLTWQGAARSLRHACFITAIGIAVITLVGYLFGFAPAGITTAWLLFYIIISVPIQEIIFRGIIQRYLHRYGARRAIAVASIAYAAIHFYNPLLVVLTLIAGIAWGSSFHRTGTLIGPIVSHAILGAVLFAFVV